MNDTLSKNLNKIKDILMISNKICIERTREMLGLDKKTFNENLLEWATELGFKIDGDYIISEKNKREENNIAISFKQEEMNKIEKVIQFVYENLMESDELTHKYQIYQELGLRKDKTYKMRNIEIILNKEFPFIFRKKNYLAKRKLQKNNN